MHRKWKRFIRKLHCNLGLNYCGKDGIVHNTKITMKGLELVQIFVVSKYYVKITGKAVAKYCMLDEIIRVDGKHIHIISSNRYDILDSELCKIRTLFKEIEDIKKSSDMLLNSTREHLASKGA